MAQYPIKMLKDENGTPFVPLVAPEAVKDTQGTDWQTLLNRKLEKTNIIAGQNVTITTEGNDITINSAAGGASANVIDNLDQTTGGVGVLDAHQGHVLKEMIPDVVNNLTTVDTTKALSAYQGYLLNNRTVPGGGTTGQVLKKKSGTDNDLEWGDAADPNAISGDSSVKKIVALTYDEYEQLVADGEIEEDTEYHIIDAPDSISEIEQNILDIQLIMNNLDGGDGTPVTNLDTLTTTGVYRYTNNTANLPSNLAQWGNVLVLNSGNYIKQILMGNYITSSGTSLPRFALRSQDTGSGWKAWEYYYPTPSDSGWQSCTISLSGLQANYFVARKIGNQVSLDGQLRNPNGVTISRGNKLGEVPAGFAPKHEVWVTCRPIGGESTIGFVYISTAGDVVYYGGTSINLGINFNAVYLVD